MAHPPAPAASYRQRKQALLEGWRHTTLSTRGVHGALRQLADLTDDSLRSLWRQASLDAGCALLAVGGYGRAELFPHSDVDVLLLLPAHADPAADAPLRERIETFIGHCWDAGLEIGASVRTVAECLQAAAGDITVQTALLEARRITGSAPLCAEFEQGFAQQLDPLAFFTAKRLEMRQRHLKY